VINTNQVFFPFPNIYPGLPNFN